MRIGLILILTVFSSNLFADSIPGVPNDLRRQFKSVHKFKEIQVEFRGSKILARLDVSESRPILFYNIPQALEQSAIDELIFQGMSKRLTYRFSRDMENDGKEYQVYLDEKKVLDSWIQVYHLDTGKIAIGTKLPDSLEPFRFGVIREGRKADGYILMNGRIVEFSETETAAGTEVRFPEGSGLPGRLRVSIEAAADTDGTLERIKLPSGTFPDQIVADKYGSIWFTQPNENLLTRFNPVDQKWERIPVGPGPDGLFIDGDGKLWFGEYDGRHVGMYDSTNKEYRRFAMSYREAMPAIPYVDHNGKVWVTDHRGNRVSVLEDLNEERWESYRASTPNAWVVQALQLDNGDPDIYSTHCYSNGLGHIDYQTREYREIPLGIEGCPAFATSVGGLLYISLWRAGSFLTVDPKKDIISEYVLSNSQFLETGIGPVSRDVEGNVFFASLRRGRIYKLNPVTKTLTYISGLRETKDGLVVDATGTVWVTEVSGALVKINFSL